MTLLVIWGMINVSVVLVPAIRWRAYRAEREADIADYVRSHPC